MLSDVIIDKVSLKNNKNRLQIKKATKFYGLFTNHFLRKIGQFWLLSHLQYNVWESFINYVSSKILEFFSK